MPRLARLRSYLPLALAIFVALLCSVPGALAVDPSVIVFQGFRNAENPSSGVYTMSSTNHNGQDARAAVLVEVKDGAWRAIQ